MLVLLVDEPYGISGCGEACFGRGNSNGPKKVVIDFVLPKMEEAGPVQKEPHIDVSALQSGQKSGALGGLVPYPHHAALALEVEAIHLLRLNSQVLRHIVPPCLNLTIQIDCAAEHAILIFV